MKKIVLSFLCLTAPVLTHAQTSLTVYGIVDTGYIRETGSDWRMGHNSENRIGFKGTEDLGSGLKALFQIEERFNLYDGTQRGPEWDGAANVGLSGHFGKIRFGRVDELTTESFRRIDPFNQNTVARAIFSTQRSARISNTARYDSPDFNGLAFGLSGTLGKNTRGTDADSALKRAGADNDGYAAMLKYEKGPWLMVANWSRLADSNKSHVANLGLAYCFGDMRLSAGYERTHDQGWKNGARSLAELAAPDDTGVKSSMDNWLLGLQYKTGTGTVNASFNYVKVKDVENVSASDGAAAWNGGHSRDMKKLGIGYTHNLSKRTSLYGVLAYTDYEDRAIANFLRGSGFNEDHVTGIQAGVTHRF